MNMKWCTALFVVLIINLNTNAFELDPICHQYYEMIQNPDLTYEDVGRIAEAMYHKQCWPAMQEETPPLAQTAGGLPSCEYLAEQLVSGSTNIAKLFGVRPMTREDCPGEGLADVNLARADTRMSKLRYNPGHGFDVWLTLAECTLLVSNPAQFAEQRPELGLRPVNCRGKIVYADGSKSGFYLYMEQYSDGDQSVWGTNVARWKW